MKLSWKFFCIAYLITLLSTGIGSAFLIQNSINMLWNSQMNRVLSAENYAINSFKSITNLSTNTITKQENTKICYQIKNILDSCISHLVITSAEDMIDKEILKLELNVGYNYFFKENGHLIMTSVCRIDSGGEEYFVSVQSDFSELQDYQKNVWRGYSIAVISIACISGGLLHYFAKKMTRPLDKLTFAAKKIAKGDYGKTVKIKTSDTEITNLTKSFNTMSIAMKKALLNIQKEVDKREQFVANFTHEMKTPMTAIIGYADMLQTYQLSQQEQHQASQAIYKEAKRLEHLSQQLLELIVTQNESPKMSKIHLLDLQQSLENTLKFLSVKYQISLNIHLPNAYIIGNKELLLSLLYNLSDNAFKASLQGSVIQIFGKQSDNTITIYVQDFGRGIESKHIAYITEPFYREDKARSRKQGGAGLGLALCKEIAELHATQLSIKSQVNQGTIVSFELKIAGEQNEEI